MVEYDGRAFAQRISAYYNVPLCDPLPQCWLKRLILVRIAFLFYLQTWLCDVHTCEFTS